MVSRGLTAVEILSPGYNLCVPTFLTFEFVSSSAAICVCVCGRDLSFIAGVVNIVSNFLRASRI